MKGNNLCMRAGLLPVLAAVVLCLNGGQLTAAAAEEDDFSYTLTEDGNAVLQCENKKIRDAVIPAEIDGHTVTEIAAHGFEACRNLQTVTIPDSLQTIHLYAFQGCEMLQSIDIPASVTNIEDFCFEECIALQQFTVSEENPSYQSIEDVLFSKDGKNLLRYPPDKSDRKYQVPDSCTTIAPWAFTDTQNLRDLNMSNVTAIGADAFMNGLYLTNVRISGGVTELIGAAFANCGLLSDVELPKDLETIGDRCFYGCFRMSRLEIPEAIQSIGEDAFFGCNALQSMTLPDSLKEIGEHGIGFTVDESGETIVNADLTVHVKAGSYAYKYARANGIAFQAKLSGGTILLILLVVFLQLMLIIGVIVTLKQGKIAREEEKNRLQEEERLKKVTALKERRKNKENQ